ncbi:MAG: hypothetical protein HRU70_13055 [Phycisphaeraceae bacterium]|nr:MAG: hypothetical protein HRU70_13055 [Phycisphaeraceae bacterium]
MTPTLPPHPIGIITNDPQPPDPAATPPRLSDHAAAWLIAALALTVTILLAHAARRRSRALAPDPRDRVLRQVAASMGLDARALRALRRLAAAPGSPHPLGLLIARDDLIRLVARDAPKATGKARADLARLAAALIEPKPTAPHSRRAARPADARPATRAA